MEESVLKWEKVEVEGNHIVLDAIFFVVLEKTINSMI